MSHFTDPFPNRRTKCWWPKTSAATPSVVATPAARDGKRIPWRPGIIPRGDGTMWILPTYTLEWLRFGGLFIFLVSVILSVHIGGVCGCLALIVGMSRCLAALGFDPLQGARNWSYGWFGQINRVPPYLPGLPLFISTLRRWQFWDYTRITKFWTKPQSMQIEPEFLLPKPAFCDTGGGDFLGTQLNFPLLSNVQLIIYPWPRPPSLETPTRCRRAARWCGV